MPRQRKPANGNAAASDDGLSAPLFSTPSEATTLPDVGREQSSSRPTASRAATTNFSLYFAPSVLQLAASFLVLPLATRRIGPAEYGVLALANAYTGIGTAVAGLGAGYLIAERFVAGRAEANRELVSTVFFAGLGAVLVYGTVLLLTWPFLPATGFVAWRYVVVAVLAMWASQPWVVALDVLTIEGRARAFAVITLTQTIVSASVVLIGLYAIGMRTGALFAAQLATALVLAVGGVAVLRRYLGFRVAPAILRELRFVGSLSALGTIMETAQIAVERTLLSWSVGIAGLGVYSHAQQYRNAVGVAIKAVARSVWPVSLQEARDVSGSFRRTQEAWNAGFVLLTLAGVAFATVGDRVIALLTNGKFTAAYVLATVWMVYLLLQNIGKPQTAILYALGGGRHYARLVLLSTTAGIATLAVLIPVIGVWGAVVAAMTQQLILRIGIQHSSAGFRAAPVQDKWAFIGSAIILGTLVLRRVLEPSFLGLLTLLVVAAVGMVVFARAPIRDAYRRVSGRAYG